MKLKNRRIILPSVLALAAFTGTSYADLLKIGVNFMGRNGGQSPLGADETAGFIAQQDWNNLGANLGGEPTGDFGNPPVNQTSSVLFTDNGSAGTRGASAVTVSVNTNDAWYADGPAGTPNERLMKGMVKAGNPVNSVLTITLNNLTVGTNYQFLSYLSVNNGASNSQGDLKVVGAADYGTLFVVEDSTFDGTFTRGTSTNSAARTDQADYAHWETVQADATGKLTFTAIWRGGGDGFGVTGFQLHELAPVSTGSVYWNNGSGSGAWDTTSTLWRTTNTAGSSNSLFATNNTAFFGDLGSAGARTVTVDAGGVTAGDIDVNNASGNDYTIGGGAILGAGALTKNGAGALTLSGANQFGGSVTIKHGTVNVSTIGDAGAAGNLGKGSSITLGDTTGSNDAVLNYSGSTATANRTLVIGSVGGAANVTTGGQTLTLTNLNGTGPLVKGGSGGLAFNGSASTFSGNIAVTGSALSVRTMASGSGTTALSAGTSFNITGPGTLSDARVLSLSGDASFGVNDAAGFYKHTSNFSTTSVLTKTGSGRLEFAGDVTFSQQPVISGGTLALTKEGSVNYPDGTINLSAGILEVVPGVLDGNNPVTLSGGALRLGHSGLQAYYWDAGYNQGDWITATNNSAYSIASAHAAIGNPVVTARTTTAGQTNLSFNPDGDNDAPFLSQGLTAADNIRAVFTGKIRIDAAGDTTFFTTSDDGSGIFIDGQRVVLNNNSQGMTTRQGTINLSAGLHDFFSYFHEGGGGAGFTAEYTPVGGARQLIPNSVLLAGDTVNYTSTNVTVTAPSSIESGAANAQLGTLTLSQNTLLTLNGSTSFTATTLGGSSHQVAVTGFNANSTLGTLSAATTLTKTGNGNLVFPAAPPAGTTIASNGGLVVAMATGGVDPLADVTLTFGGGGLGLSSFGGDVTFTKPVSSSSNLAIVAGAFGNSNFAATNIIFNPTGGLAAPAGNALTLRTNDQNYTLNVTPQITGTGSIIVEEGTINLNSGVSNVGGNFTNRIAKLTVNGNIATNALLNDGNFNGLADGLIAGGFDRGFTTITGTTNATSITTANGTLNTAGTATAGSASVTGGTYNANGILNVSGALSVSGGTLNTAGTATAGSASITGGTYNANAGLNVSGALSVSGGTANTNGVLSAGSVTVGGTGALNVKNSATVSGITSVTNGRTLNLDMGNGNSRTYAGSVTVNAQSTLRAASGTTDFGTSAITVTPFAYSSGLIESMNENAGNADAAFTLGQGRVGQPTTGGVKNGFRLGNNNTVNGTTEWGDNDLWVYSGQFYDADGQFSFAENIDDQTRVRIDGVLVLSSDQWDFASNTNSTVNNTGPGGPVPNTGNNYGMGPAGDGWHNIEVRMYNGGGGAGPSGNNNNSGATNWSGAKGFAFSSTGNTGLDANNFTILTDPGNASVLRTTNASTGGYVTIEAGAKIAAGSVTGAQVLQLNGSAAVFQLNSNGSATASTADTVKVNGASASGSLLLGDNNTLTVGRLVVPDGGTLTIDKAAGATTGGVVKTSGLVPDLGSGQKPSTIGTGNVNVLGGTLLVNSAVTGSGTLKASVSGTIGGTGPIAGPVTADPGGTIAPGGGAGFEQAALSTGNLTLNAGSSLAIQLTDSLGYDSVNVTGGVTLGGTLNASKFSFAASPGDLFFIIINDGGDAVSGTFFGLADDALTIIGNEDFRISYDANLATNSLSGGNDVALLYVPEPGSAVMLLSGLGMLMGSRRFRRRQA